MEPDNEPARNFNVGNLLLTSDVLGNQINGEFVVEPNATVNGANVIVSLDPIAADKPELTCISEEGIADMDLPDNIFDDFDYIGDCITSCNKVKSAAAVTVPVVKNPFTNHLPRAVHVLQKVSKGILIKMHEFVYALKVEQYLMLSEFENNINADLPTTQTNRNICTVEDET